MPGETVSITSIISSLQPSTKAPVTAAAGPSIAETIATGALDRSPAADRAQQAIQAMKQANANWRGLRRSMAGFRLQYAQAALKALMFFGGDPVVTARRAAQLARQVRAAAQDYVAAGGDPSAAPTDASAPVPASTPATGAANAADAANSFVEQARVTVAALRAIVARARYLESHRAARDQAMISFDAAATGADTAIDRTATSSESSTDALNLLI